MGSYLYLIKYFFNSILEVVVIPLRRSPLYPFSHSDVQERGIFAEASQRPGRPIRAPLLYIVVSTVLHPKLYLPCVWLYTDRSRLQRVEHQLLASLSPLFFRRSVQCYNVLVCPCSESSSRFYAHVVPVVMSAVLACLYMRKDYNRAWKQSCCHEQLIYFRYSVYEFENKCTCNVNLVWTRRAVKLPQKRAVVDFEWLPVSLVAKRPSNKVYCRHLYVRAATLIHKLRAKLAIRGMLTVGRPVLERSPVTPGA